MRKPAFCICENKDADQLRGNREADQRLCFRYTDSTISLLPVFLFSVSKPPLLENSTASCANNDLIFLVKVYLHFILTLH